MIPERTQQVALLTTGTIDIVGRIVGSSNATFVVIVTDPPAEPEAPASETFAIYKPEAGERPLWDFPSGLYRRELAAYLLSEHLGWGLVPPTVVREDAPVGVGSLQWYVDGAERDHYFTLVTDPAVRDELVRIAVFDVVTNNTDRKSGHVLRGDDGRLWAIDHGLCFAAEEKLRTVIWDFAGTPLPDALAADLTPLADELPADVAEHLDAREQRALRNRVRRLLLSGILPFDDSGRRWPWPLV